MAITTIINVWWIANYCNIVNWVLKGIANASRMTTEWLRRHSPEFEAAPPKRNKVRPRKKIKRSGKCRRYISAKKKGKQQRIGDKSNKT